PCWLQPCWVDPLWLEPRGSSRLTFYEVGTVGWMASRSQSMTVLHRSWRRPNFCRRLCCTVPLGFLGVSSYGRVQNKHGIIHWGTRQPDGYHITGIGYQSMLVHRLVAHTFIGPPSGGDRYEVNHIDGNKSNNRVDNLEYVSRAQNMLHHFRTKLLQRRSSTEANSKPVFARICGSQTWTRFDSIKGAAISLKVCASNFFSCCKGKLTSVGGVEFRYAESIARPGEEWRTALCPCSGLPLTSWEVSSHGRVKNSKSLISRGSLAASGYRVVCASLYGRLSALRVHRLVARAFLGPAPDSERHLVHHKDSDRGNNHVDNLQYVTASENAQYSHQRGPRSTKNRVVPVQARLSGTESWITYPSVSEASLLLSVPTSSISRCCHGSQQSAKGYEFKRADIYKLCGEEWRQIAS
ncbi:unnamed protein product, partial [Prorocentrum cordatum]